MTPSFEREPGLSRLLVVVPIDQRRGNQYDSAEHEQQVAEVTVGHP